VRWSNASAIDPFITAHSFSPVAEQAVTAYFQYKEIGHAGLRPKEKEENDERPEIARAGH
jgi:hypothetical protein